MTDWSSALYFKNSTEFANSILYGFNFMYYLSIITIVTATKILLLLGVATTGGRGPVTPIWIGTSHEIRPKPVSDGAGQW